MGGDNAIARVYTKVSSMLPSLSRMSASVVDVVPFQVSLNTRGNGETTTQVTKTNDEIESGVRCHMIGVVAERLRWQSKCVCGSG